MSWSWNDIPQRCMILKTLRIENGYKVRSTLGLNLYGNSYVMLISEKCALYRLVLKNEIFILKEQFERRWIGCPVEEMLCLCFFNIQENRDYVRRNNYCWIDCWYLLIFYDPLICMPMHTVLWKAVLIELMSHLSHERRNSYYEGKWKHLKDSAWIQRTCHFTTILKCRLPRFWEHLAFCIQIASEASVYSFPPLAVFGIFLT